MLHLPVLDGTWHRAHLKITSLPQLNLFQDRTKKAGEIPMYRLCDKAPKVTFVQLHTLISSD
jgi:hypothetical protein